jgi:hypothetical protein
MASGWDARANWRYFLRRVEVESSGFALKISYKVRLDSGSKGLGEAASRYVCSARCLAEGILGKLLVGATKKAETVFRQEATTNSSRIEIRLFGVFMELIIFAAGLFQNAKKKI